MDYETPDGSQFSLVEVWTERDDEPVFDYTTVSAYVNDVAYTGKLLARADDVDEGDVLDSLEQVPPECIHPPFREHCTIAPQYDVSRHYLKAPWFTYDDCKPGKTIRADCLLNEVTILELLAKTPHPNVVSYLGCGMKDGRITHICLERYECNLSTYVSNGFEESDAERLLGGIKAGIEHLHALGLAHNDINPDNICVDKAGNAIIVDFDSTRPFGEKLLKGVAMQTYPAGEAPVSNKQSDLLGLDDVRDFLWDSLDEQNKT